mmetsp:Transcript_15572/g.23556  ORF Transcript_15572/g.23556 Transcript_15572/m.23556 type:complete len:283 (+) Transcript_15572:140-988(+)|eukprot:scaffold23692_cov155-Skeletonema_dohrnii-CCMP3373.AAC.6
MASKDTNYINYSKYPIDQFENDVDGKYNYLLQNSIKQINCDGFVSLPSFLLPDAVDKLTACILKLEEDGVGFYSSDSHNVFLDADDQSDAMSPLHPRRIQLDSSKLIINASDLLLAKEAQAPNLDELFMSQRSVLNFISSVMQTKLYPSTDPYGKFYANIFREGDGLNYHFDRSEYSISLILQPSEEGGEFQFLPNSRTIVEGWDEMILDIDDIAEAVAPHSLEMKRPKLAAGDLYLFRGQNSLHRVSEITKGKRINIILTFNTEPDVRLNHYTLQKFFGVI